MKEFSLSRTAAPLTSDNFFANSEHVFPAGRRRRDPAGVILAVLAISFLAPLVSLKNDAFPRLATL
jgi:hypothetical protein